MACGTLRGSRGRKESDYTADFVLISRRHLTAAEYDIFRFYFLLSADWKMCCKRLNIERGTFFHAVYRIEQKLGQAFRETQPYGLFRGYFSSPTRGEIVKPLPVVPERYTNGLPLRAPLRPVPETAGKESVVCEAVPVICEPDTAPPVPALPAVIVWDAPRIQDHVREQFRADKSLRSIAASLIQMRAPVPPTAKKWTPLAVWRVLQAA